MRTTTAVPRCAQVLTLPLVIASCDFAYTWRSMGPFETSGPIRHLIVDPVRANRLYAAAENGGLWVMDDATASGASWRPLSDQLENLQMRGVAKSMVDSGYIVTANALGFVYHTEDHGATWERIVDQSFSYIRRLLLNVGLTRIQDGNYSRLAKETTVLVAGRTGLHRLRLINDNFDRVDTLFPRDTTHGDDVLDLTRDPVDASRLFIGVRGQGVWRSEDTGETWELVAPWATFGDTLTPMIRLTTNGARTVAKLGRNIVVNDQRGDAPGWRTVTMPGYPANDDGGNDIGYRGNYSGTRGEWTHALAIHPSDTSIMAAGQTSLFTTSDGGANWTGLSSGHEDIQALAFSPNGQRLYIANDGGIWVRNLSTGTIASLNRNLATLQFYRAAKNGSVVAGNADHQGIRGTRNIEATPPAWEYATSGASGYGNNALENDFVFGDPRIANRFYVAFEDDHILRLRYPPTPNTQDLLAMNDTSARVRPFTMLTNNRAVNNQLNYPVGSVAFDVRPNSNVMLVAAHNVENASFVIRITQQRQLNPTGGPRNNCGDASGATFCFTAPLQNTALFTTSFGPVNTPIVSLAFSPREPGKAYALLQNGTVTVNPTIDDSTAWDTLGTVPLEPNGVARQILTDATSAAQLYAISHGAFFVSADSGRTWARRGQATLDTMRLHALAQHPTNTGTLYIGTAREVRVSDDRGVSWRSIGATLPNVNVMQLLTDGGFVYAVTFGRGLWRARMPR